MKRSGLSPKRWLLLCVLAWIAVSTRPACAWHETGHMVVARIAMDHLDPATKLQIEHLAGVRDNPLVGVPCDERNDAFITGTCWLDDIRKRNKNFGRWHYIDYPYSPDGTPTQPQDNNENVVLGIDNNVALLANSSASDAQRAEAVRFLTHFVGDIHQPLHCIQLYSKRFPEGDRGGNRFQIASADANLHAFWDEGGDGLPDVRRPLSEDGARLLTSLARDIEHEFDADTLNELRLHPRAEQWAVESFQMAREIAYNGIEPGAVPSDSYVARAQHACRRRLALAGYRLARLLNEALGK